MRLNCGEAIRTPRFASPTFGCRAPPMSWEVSTILATCLGRASQVFFKPPRLLPALRAGRAMRRKRNGVRHRFGSLVGHANDQKPVAVTDPTSQPLILPDR